MERQEFYDTVAQRANLADRDDAEDATRAVLTAVGERLPEAVSQRASGDLPREIGSHLTDGDSNRRVSYDEFLERVEERTNRASTGDPETLAQVVTETTLEHVDGEERGEIVERLEAAGYDDLFTGIEPDSGSGASD